MPLGKIEKGICKECQLPKYIVNKSKKLCQICNQKRLQSNKKPKEKKPKNRNAKRNQDFYLEIWNSKPHFCEECGLYLRSYSANYISHIIPKGANTFLRSDPENARIYCQDCHTIYEFGNRKGMKTWNENEKIKEKLTLKYYLSK